MRSNVSDIYAFASAHTELREFGERTIIEQFIVPLLSEEFGNVLLDDCAIVNLGDTSLLLSLDQGPRRTFLELLDVGEPDDIGHFHVTINASDVAAMGGEPIGILLGLSLVGNESAGYLARYLDGVHAAMCEYDLQLLGGDTKQSRLRSTTITVLGRALESGPIQRRGASVGDQIFISPGNIGRCLASYVHAARRSRRSRNIRIVRPRAEIELGKTLASMHIATSCMDMSDGLLASAEQLGKINGMSFLVEVEAIPFAASPVPPRDRAWKNLVVNVGGDFGLMFTTSSSDAALAESIGCTRIGEVLSDGQGVRIEERAGSDSIEVRTWEQFKTVESTSDEILSFTRE